MTNRYTDWNQQIIDEFRANGGDVSSRGFGRSLVLLHNIGAKSGVERVSPVMAIHDDPDTWLIAASKAGAHENPAWYHNLLAHPDVTIETPDDGIVDVHADALTGPARDAAWARFLAKSPGFHQYEQRTSRTIPVLTLRRQGAAPNMH
ncbi:MAG: nitroreductase/quinone reductase family protein [Leifsonia flava]